MRGKEKRLATVWSKFRITPACAGKRPAQTSAGTRRRDHPRVCGEKHHAPSRFPSRTGSPPRVRGKALHRTTGTASTGITPACAGKSRASTSSSRTVGDHPRVCGEKSGRRADREAGVGSPPRVRGKGVKRCTKIGVEGITPACAGKSTNTAGGDARSRDHPRVCGEKTKESLKK